MMLRTDLDLSDQQIDGIFKANYNKMKISNMIFRLCKDENRKPNQDERTKIMALNSGAVHSLAKKYFSS